MQEAAQAYQRTAQQTAAPREQEAQLLLQAASQLQAIAEGGLTDRREIAAAIRFNRTLWTVLATSATNAANPLPEALKHSVAQLGVFILNHSLKLEIQPERERFGVLISINRQIAAGLRESSAPAAGSQAVSAA